MSFKNILASTGHDTIESYRPLFAYARAITLNQDPGTSSCESPVVDPSIQEALDQAVQRGTRLDHLAVRKEAVQSGIHVSFYFTTESTLSTGNSAAPSDNSESQSQTHDCSFLRCLVDRIAETNDAFNFTHIMFRPNELWIRRFVMGLLVQTVTYPAGLAKQLLAEYEGSCQQDTDWCIYPDELRSPHWAQWILKADTRAPVAGW